ncbi:MAG: hypothetical protein KDC68_09195, partial [Gelidibacter sp.]|nr:hypothetical protein [Gelidibacter sp.]
MVQRFLVVLLVGYNTLAFGQSETLFCKQLSALQELLQQVHYNPKPINDSLSKGVFKLFIEGLDTDQRFFTQSDIAFFKTDEYQLDNDIQSYACSFITKYSDTLKKRIANTKAYLQSLTDVPLDYTGKDTLYFKPNNDFGYFKTDADAKRYWNKRIRYLILNQLTENDSILDNIQTHFSALEQELKPKIIQNQLCLLEEILHKNGDIDTFVNETFLNAFANYEDPNTSFFNKTDKTLFEDTLANNQLTFGINTTKNNDGDIVITYITPGSAAYLNGKLEENDIIKSLSAGNEVLETYCASNDDILAFTTNEHNATITFKIKKPNGTIEDVELTKTLLKVEENSVTGYLLGDKAEIGYIKIPSFYTDLDDPEGFGVTNDVAQELYKLNDEKVKGLIIDLRFNGGGSMKEGTQLSGLFINQGPLAILKYNNGDTYTVNDPYRGALFNKPMVILINNYSASASELFASAMQDYHRALIVGSPSHGKSSAQVILPLNDVEDLGFCKVTMEKFYRITGQSHQSIGVQPDILLPSLYDILKTNERYSNYALQNDTIAAAINYKPLKPLPLYKLKAKSYQRVSENKIFSAIVQQNDTLSSAYINKEFQYPLTLKNVFNDTSAYNALWEQFYEQTDDISP